jgi:hypothetical protein
MGLSLLDRSISFDFHFNDIRIECKSKSPEQLQPDFCRQISLIQLESP